MCKIADGIILILFVCCSISDWKKKEIPIFLLVVMSVVVAVFAILCDNISTEARAGGALLGVLFFAVSKCSKEAIGYGDSWLILLLGVHLGVLVTLQILFAASVFAGIASIFVLWRCGWKRKKTIPFIPYLTAAFLGTVIL